MLDDKVQFYPTHKRAGVFVKRQHIPERDAQWLFDGLTELLFDFYANKGIALTSAEMGESFPLLFVPEVIPGNDSIPPTVKSYSPIVRRYNHKVVYHEIPESKVTEIVVKGVTIGEKYEVQPELVHSLVSLLQLSPQKIPRKNPQADYASNEGFDVFNQFMIFFDLPKPEQAYSPRPEGVTIRMRDTFHAYALERTRR